MTFVQTGLEGVILIAPRIFPDDRGYFFESYNESVWKENGVTANFIQDNQSQSAYGVIRGLHCQTGAHAQAKLVRVLQGKILDVVVDIRAGSPTFGRHVSCELSSENRQQIFVPRGFLHGFSVLSETATVAYKCDNAYHKSAETGVRYNDESLAIDWKIPKPDAILSEKDLLLGGLRDIAPYKA